ncbi:MAG: DUF3604 domain-containing protein [Pseudomonadales bacterium]
MSTAKRIKKTISGLLLLGTLSSTVPQFVFAQALPFDRTEEREPCADYDVLKRPMFGDLHVHTSYSHDSYTSKQRNDPWAAYRYAKGEAITLPNQHGDQTVIARIQRPMDFTAVTDHAEHLGLLNLCTQDPWKLGYWWPHCIMTRSNNMWLQLFAVNRYGMLGGATEAGHQQSIACTLSDCDETTANTWANIQQAAEEHYDRSSGCSFTTFVAYEFTDAPNRNNMHRNVIFRNENVTERPISTYDTGSYNFPKLWKMLREQCIDEDKGCDVLAIPHNPNLSGGLMFRDPETPDEATDRLYFEPVIELTQHKASSECRFDRLIGKGLFTEDELCDFEQVVADNLSMLGSVHGEVMAETAAAVPIDKFARRNMARNALKDGLMLAQKTGVNPFTFGFIGSTDTHSATAGGAEEDNYVGHLGWRDASYRNVQDHFSSNPGGHAVVWAEENSRDAIFNGLRRKETYATSGTRPIVRFFGGADMDQDICQTPDMITQAYRQGVAMGGEFASVNAGASPRFLVSVQKDSGSVDHPGTDLQRIQIIKGWVDADGKTHEQVFDVAGDSNNNATVDPNTCEPVGVGFRELCTVWEDPEFNRSHAAFYYVRVLENPTCRWSTLHCQAAKVNPFSEDCQAQAKAATALAIEDGAKGDVFGKCCLAVEDEPFYSPVIQERAWTSPIWYSP